MTSHAVSRTRWMKIKRKRIGDGATRPLPGSASVPAHKWSLINEVTLFAKHRQKYFLSDCYIFIIMEPFTPLIVHAHDDDVMSD